MWTKQFGFSISVSDANFTPVDEIEGLSYPFEEWMEEIDPLVSAQFNAQNFATLSEENLKQEQNKCLELQEGVQAQRFSIGKLQKNMLMIEALY